MVHVAVLVIVQYEIRVGPVNESRDDGASSRAVHLDVCGDLLNFRVLVTTVRATYAGVAALIVVLAVPYAAVIQDDVDAQSVVEGGWLRWHYGGRIALSRERHDKKVPANASLRTLTTQGWI